MNKLNRQQFKEAMYRLSREIESEISEAEMFGEEWMLEIENKTQGTTLMFPSSAFWKKEEK